MAEETRQNQGREVEDVRDPRSGRVVARYDRATEKLRVKPYRDRAIWLDVRRLLDKERAK